MTTTDHQLEGIRASAEAARALVRARRLTDAELDDAAESDDRAAAAIARLEQERRRGPELYRRHARPGHLATCTADRCYCGQLCPVFLGTGPCTCDDDPGPITEGRISCPAEACDCANCGMPLHVGDRAVTNGADIHCDELCARSAARLATHLDRFGHLRLTELPGGAR